MHESVALQQQLGSVFDITLDVEDGFVTGNEASHAQLIASIINSEDNRFDRIGGHILDRRRIFFQQDTALLCQSAAKRLACLVVFKINDIADARHVIERINQLPGKPAAARCQYTFAN